MTALAEKQFEILPSEDATDGFVFGIGADVSINDDGFDPGDMNWFAQSTDNTRRGVRGSGRDVLGPKTWMWTSHVDQDDVESAATVLEAFADAWSPEEVLRQPGAQIPLRYRLAGRNRRVYGRPRRFAAPPSNLIDSGFVLVTHDFETVDSYTYDDVESMAVIPYASSVSGGGFVLPAPMPLVTLPSEGNGSDQITVTGTSRAYPIIRFNGPWTNPVMTTNDWTLTWTGEIGPTGWIEIDTRPWKLTVLDQNGGSAVDGLDRRTWLEDLWFAPNSQPQINLAGAAASGGASAVIRWRNTWKSI